VSVCFPQPEVRFIEVCKSSNLDECRNSTDPAEWTALQ